MKLRYTGKTGLRRVNGRPLANGEVFEVPDEDGECMSAMIDIEKADAPAGDSDPLPVVPQVEE